MPFLDGIQPFRDDNWGEWARRQDALKGAGNALNAPDADAGTVRNNLLAAGQPDAANTVQGWAKTQADQDRQGEQDAQAEKLRGDVRAVGTLAAAGTPEALQAARQEAFKRGLFDHASSMDTMLTKARGDIANKVGGLALNTTPEEWSATAPALLQKWGIDPAGYEGPEGHARALAESPYSKDIYKTRATSDLQDQRQQGAMEVARLKADRGTAGTAFTKNVAYVKSAYPGIDEGSAEQVAANPRLWRVQAQDNGGGQPSYTLTKIDAGTKTAVDAADRIARENADANAKDGGDRPTDFGDLYWRYSGKASTAQNAATRQQVTQFNTNPGQPGSMAYARTPEGAGAISEARAAGQVDAKTIGQRAAIVGGAIAHARSLVEELQKPEAEQTIGLIHSSPEYQNWRAQIWPSDVAVPASWGKIGQDITSLQAEAERVYTTGQGVVTDAERTALKDLAQRIRTAPNREVALHLALNLQHLMAGILTAPKTSDVLKSAPLAAARQEGMRAVEGIVQPQQSAPRRMRYNPQTQTMEPIQ